MKLCVFSESWKDNFNISLKHTKQFNPRRHNFLESYLWEGVGGGGMQSFHHTNEAEQHVISESTNTGLYAL